MHEFRDAIIIGVIAICAVTGAYTLLLGVVSFSKGFLL